MNDDAVKDTRIIIMIIVMKIKDRISDQKKCLPFLTLKTTFKAFSIEEKN
jgi:hypothetical protein